VLGVLPTTSVVLTYALSVAVRLDRFDTLRVSGLAIGLVGILLILLPRASLPAPDQTFWVLVGLLAPFFYSATNVVTAALRPPGLDSLGMAAVVQLLAASFMLAFMLLVGGWSWIPLALDAPNVALLIQCFIAALTTILWIEVIRLAGPVFMSQVGFITTSTGVAWGMLLFGERHSAWVWAAIVCVLVGLTLVTRGTARRV
jgi:drug/metabolite transporter (DMT)-like permease